MCHQAMARQLAEHHYETGVPASLWNRIVFISVSPSCLHRYLCLWIFLGFEETTLLASC